MITTDPKTRLDRLLAEVRAQRPPPAAERGLPARLRMEFRSRATGPGVARVGGITNRAGAGGLAAAGSAGTGARWLLAAALLGGVALLLAWPSEVSLERPPLRLPSERSPSASEPAASSPGAITYDGDALALDTLLVAGEQSSSVQHGSRARWVLAAGSRAQLLSSGSVLRVSLERGSLEAEVQPSVQPESFVVQARGTEVAVHGTRFRVRLDGDRVHVEVEQGSVQVRPLGEHAGTVLSAPLQADFLAGAVLPASAPLGERPSAQRERVREAADEPRPPARPSLASDQPEPLPVPAQPARPTTGDRAAAALPVAPPDAFTAPDAAGERALQSVTEHVQRCFHRYIPGSREIGIEVSTRLGLWVEASGQLLRADFDPPLAPAIEACVAEKLAQFRAAPSPEGYRIERRLLLHH